MSADGVLLAEAVQRPSMFLLRGKRPSNDELPRIVAGPLPNRNRKSRLFSAP
jgi:hypothetical protein